MNTCGERIKIVRKDKKLTLEKFGEKIGMKKNSLSQIENNVNGVSEQLKRSICREFNVNYAWLDSGVGEKYSDINATLLGRLKAEYELSDTQMRIIEAVLELTDEQINMFTMKFFGFEAIKKEDE